MWYFTWILGVLLACAFGIINVIWMESEGGRMFAMGSSQETDTNSAGSVLSVVSGLMLLGLIVWWLFRWVSRREVEALYGEAPAVPQTERRADDLTRIEGIGPKVASVLQEAGIRDFEALSRGEPVELQEVLNASGLR